MSDVHAPSTLPDQVVNAIRSVVGFGSVALHEPTFNGNEWVYLKECLGNNNIRRGCKKTP